MRNIDSALQPFAPEAPGALPQIYGSQFSIFLPPSVKVVETNGQHWLEYPIPKYWKDVMNEPRWVGELTGLGWHASEDTVSANLLNSFLRLANCEGPKGAERVRQFVLRFGPLFRCQTQSHDYKMWADGCYWPSLTYADSLPESQLCSWCGLEPVAAFVELAQRASAILKAALVLQKGSLLSDSQVNALGLFAQSWAPDLAMQRRDFSLTVNRLHTGINSPHTFMTWNGDTPQLHLVGGLGFIHAVWFKAAQVACMAQGVAQCAYCKAMYFPKQKPREDRANYCDECQANRAAKRAYDQRNPKSKRGTTP